MKRLAKFMTVLWIAGVIAGCGSSLSYKVEVYDLDSPPGRDGELSRGRAEYNRLHPKRDLNFREAVQPLTGLQTNLRKYRENLTLINELDAYLVSDEAAASKEFELRKNSIERLFQPITAAVDAELKLVQSAVGYEQGNSTWLGAAAIRGHLTLLEGALKRVADNGSIITDTALLRENLIGAVADFESNKTVKDRYSGLLHRLDSDGRAETFSGTIARLLELVEPRYMQAESSIVAAAASLAPSGDLLDRRHEPYQDLSDPFLQHIAKMPHGWKHVGNGGSVSGDGDTEFILVFEKGLDGRWKSVSVDPTKVIAARLRIGRAAVNTVAALGGIAAGAFGVPLGKFGTGSSGAGSSEIKDYSEMTAELVTAEEQLESGRKELRRIREVARDMLRRLDALPTGTPEEIAQKEELAKQLKKELEIELARFKNDDR
ncbi:MAG: hypothetical protein ICCCNLDF_03579 [Planctomycetes bacterium]|nr:hypothetical protein [Planctomycetota bacterium]